MIGKTGGGKPGIPGGAVPLGTPGVLPLVRHLKMGKVSRIR